MKVRSGFVSNSSSASFTIYTDKKYFMNDMEALAYMKNNPDKEVIVFTACRGDGVIAFIPNDFQRKWVIENSDKVFGNRSTFIVTDWEEETPLVESAYRDYAFLYYYNIEHSIKVENRFDARLEFEVDYCNLLREDMTDKKSEEVLRSIYGE